MPMADVRDVLQGGLQQIAAWRDNGGQPFLDVHRLGAWVRDLELEPVPSLSELDAAAMPASHQDTYAWMSALLPATRGALDEGAGGRPEGMIVRTADRKRIVKIRYEDYERTLGKRNK